jgi:hypothetical protein
MRCIAIASALALSALGCAHTQGSPDAAARAKELTPGVSTLANAKAIIGEPSEVRDYGTMGSCSTWTYSEARWGMHQRTTFIFLCFDADGTLVPGLPTLPRSAGVPAETPR